MFERAVILNARGGTQRRAVLFPVSVALHGIVATGFIVSAVWSVSFPAQAPPQFQTLVYHSTPKVPDPAPQPKPIRVTQPVTTQQKGPQSIFTEPQQLVRSIVTPNQIPNTIPEVTATSGIGEVVQAVPTNIGGPIGQVIEAPGDDANPIQVAANPKIVAPVVTLRVEPVYPTILIPARLTGMAVVECTVGRDGTVQEVRPINATHPLFEASAVQAVRQWKFRAGSLNGRAVATIFTLVVRFEIKR